MDEVMNDNSRPLDHLNSVGRGWHKLLRPILVECEFRNIRVTQVKEKFGGLRVYVYSADDFIEGMIKPAEILSTKTCESCGAPGGLDSTTSSWIKCLCKACIEKRRRSS